MKPDRTHESRIWRTEDEIEFLRDLGRGIHSKEVFTPRKELLRNYERAMEGRKWDKNIDPTAINNYLRGCYGM